MECAYYFASWNGIAVKRWTPQRDYWKPESRHNQSALGESLSLESLGILLSEFSVGISCNSDRTESMVACESRITF